MPDWKQLTDEINEQGSTYDIIRKKYIEKLAEVTKQNVIIYYSFWLQRTDLIRQGLTGYEINDLDKNGFMSAIHDMDRTKGLDLVLHTPGGALSAAESLVDYLRKMFDCNIRAIIPQLAMSAGTMIALSCEKIIMGKHSSLGPIDPQIGNLPAHGIIEEFNRAKNEIATNPSCIPIWQPIIAKYNPTLIGECQKAMEWSEEIVKEWLKTGMFKNDSEADLKISKVIEELGSHAVTKAHDRHISASKAIELQLNIEMLEDNDELQEAVLSVHHACMASLSYTPTMKIIQNHKNTAFIQSYTIKQ